MSGSDPRDRQPQTRARSTWHARAKSLASGLDARAHAYRGAALTDRLTCFEHSRTIALELIPPASFRLFSFQCIRQQAKSPMVARRTPARPLLRLLAPALLAALLLLVHAAVATTTTTTTTTAAGAKAVSSRPGPPSKRKSVSSVRGVVQHPPRETHGVRVEWGGGVGCATDARSARCLFKWN